MSDFVACTEARVDDNAARDSPGLQRGRKVNIGEATGTSPRNPSPCRGTQLTPRGDR